MKKLKQWLMVAMLLVGGGFLVQQILAIKSAAPITNEPSPGDEGGTPAMDAEDEAADTEQAKGPHGGKYFEDGKFALELTIYEDGVPPEFRAYVYENGKPIAPTLARVMVTLSRLGATPQVFNLIPEGDYLADDQVVDEPHSFDVAITAEHAQTHHWRYSQAEARVEMSDATLAAAGIEVKTAGPATIKSALQLPGEIQFNMDRFVLVVPRVDGVVVESPVVSGQHIKQGDVLLVLDSQHLAELRSELATARKRRAVASLAHNRERKLWEEKISPKQDYLAAQQVFAEADIATESARQRLEALGVTANGDPRRLTRYEIRSPIEGVIIVKDVALGEAVKDDKTVFKIADLSNVWVEFTVNAQALSSLRTGQPATIRANGVALQATGTVAYIGSLLGEQTRTAKARITLPNPDGSWRSGMFVTVDVTAEEFEVPVAVAADALQTVRDWTVVFGRYGEFLEARPLELGRSDGTMVEVLKGLAAGEHYAAGNSFTLKAELGKAGASHDH